MSTIYIQGTEIKIQAAKNCTLAGVVFKKNDWIIIELAIDWDIEQNIGDGGSWGFGGFSASTIKRVASKIIDAQTGQTIWRKTNDAQPI